MPGDGDGNNHGDEFAIDLRGVTKTYRGRVPALRGVGMRVRRGEIFGLLGPNGAGKSTLVKIMMTVVRPTRAEGTVLGRPVGHKPTLGRVGYLPENHRFPRYLTGRQVLEFFGALARVDRATRRRRSAELLETVGMADWGDRRVSTYSKGMMQRVGLAQALINAPDLVVLDEPTDGVDPVGRRDIRDVLLSLRGQGRTVFVNSHLLSELELVCDRVAIMVRGQVVRQGTLNELAVSQQWYDIELALGDPAVHRERLLRALPATFGTSAAGESARGRPTLDYANPSETAPPEPGIDGADHGRLNDGVWVEIRGATVRVGTTDAAAVQPVLDALRSAGFILRRVQPVRPSLEELFMEAVTDPGTGKALAPGAARAQ